MELEVFWNINGFVIDNGVMNLLPIPALDGGHVMFYYTKLFQAKPSDKF
jgi:regulator of sigma E protease